MPATVPVVLVLESTLSPTSDSDLFLASVCEELDSAGLESTFLFDGARATELLGPRHHDLATRLKRHTVGLIAGDDQSTPLAYLAGLDWETGGRTFRTREHRRFLEVSKLAGHLPTAMTLGQWAPQAFSVISDWGPRCYLGPDSFVDNDTKPFFICGRLHLASLGSYWIDVSLHSLMDGPSIHGVASQVLRRAEQLASSGGAIVLRLAHEQLAAVQPSNAAECARGLRELLDQVRKVPGITVQSARQFADQYADISYDQAIPLDFLRSMAELAREPELHAIEHELGYFSPAEQLYAIAKIWVDSIVKGKALRNTTIRTPLGPSHKEETDPSVKGIAADELHDLLAGLIHTFDNKGQLPSSVTTREGKLAIEDLLPTLAGGFTADLKPVDLPLRVGKIDSTPLKVGPIRDALAAARAPEESLANLLALTERQLWTFKPALGL